jgi:hypothetical protein
VYRNPISESDWIFIPFLTRPIQSLIHARSMLAPRTQGSEAEIAAFSLVYPMNRVVPASQKIIIQPASTKKVSSVSSFPQKGKRTMTIVRGWSPGRDTDCFLPVFRTVYYLPAFLCLPKLRTMRFPLFGLIFEAIMIAAVSSAIGTFDFNPS